jgi:hypothetical protein
LELWGLLNDECSWNCFRVWVILNVNDSGGYGHGLGLGETNARGCGFRGLFGETPILGLFTIGSVPRIVPRISLTCTPDSKTLSRNCRRGGGLFLCFSYSASPSSSESVCVRVSCFFGLGPDIGSSPSSLSFFLSIWAGKM